MTKKTEQEETLRRALARILESFEGVHIIAYNVDDMGFITTYRENFGDRDILNAIALAEGVRVQESLEP